MLVFVACPVTSKNTGIGVFERNCGDIKKVKPGKLSGLASYSTEKRPIIYTIARAKEARLMMIAAEDGRMEEVRFEEQDLAFDEDLADAGVVVKNLKRPPEKRVFRTWLSNKEKKWAKKKEAIHKTGLLKSLRCRSSMIPAIR